jgi:hypothetical protein
LQLLFDLNPEVRPANNCQVIDALANRGIPAEVSAKMARRARVDLLAQTLAAWLRCGCEKLVAKLKLMLPLGGVNSPRNLGGKPF